MNVIDFAQVGANIQKQLDMKGMTQQNLADALHISKQVMNKIIKGGKAINVKELAQIADVLCVSTDDLLMISYDAAKQESLSFMGYVEDESTLQSIDLIRTAIDEICLLEELLDV